MADSLPRSRSPVDSPAGSPALRLVDVHKRYDSGGRPLEILRGISFELAAGEAMAITGPSGSGKSTLLHVLGTLDPPSSGSVEILGRRPFELPERELARFRNAHVGFVFQDHHLLPQYSVLENVLVPTLAFPGAIEPAAARSRALELLRRVGLDDRLEHRPAQLSGGERQRVAVARALVNRPTLLLGDEPTGSLDHATATAIGELLHELHRQEGSVLVVVTHSLELAATFPRRLEL